MTLSLAAILVGAVVALYFLGRTTVLTALICMAAGVALAPTPMGSVLLMVPKALVTAIGAGFSAVF